MLLVLRFTFAALIPLGIFLLLKAIKLLRASFFGEVLLEVPLSPARRSLRLPDDGLYAIWLKGARRQAAVGPGFRPAIWETATGAAMHLAPTIATVQASGTDGYRTQAFTFEALTGDYTVEIPAIPQPSGAGNLLANFFGKTIDPARLSMQIRKAKPFYYGLGGILLCVLSGFMILGGIVLLILADKLVNAHS